MEIASKRKKRVGKVLKKHPPRKPKWDFSRKTIADLDFNSPIIKNDISREGIYNILWDYLASTVASKFLSVDQIEAPESFSWIIVEEKIEALTEILSYSFSSKKPNGLGSKSKDSKRSTRDITLADLENFPKIRNKIRISDDLKEFFPMLSQEIEELNSLDVANLEENLWIKKKSDLLRKYKELANFETDKIKKVVGAIKILKMGFGTIAGYNSQEIRDLLYESINFFKDKFLLVPHVKYNSLQRLVRFRIDDYEWYENGNRVLVKPKVKNKSEKRKLEKDDFYKSSKIKNYTRF